MPKHGKVSKYIAKFCCNNLLDCQLSTYLSINKQERRQYKRDLKLTKTLQGWIEWKRFLPTLHIHGWKTLQTWTLA